MALTNDQKQQLAMRAMKDETFRAALLRDAKAAVSAALQIPPLPAAYQLHVVQADPQRIVLVLPPRPAECPTNASVDVLRGYLWQDVPTAEAGQQRVLDGQATLIANAWHDPAYKQALLQDPRAVVEREFGTALPADVTMQALAEDANTQYLLLSPALDDLELSDEQLEQVAGGELIVSLTIIATAAATISGVVGGTVSYGVGHGW
jgi:hypothetical protein